MPAFHSRGTATLGLGGRPGDGLVKRRQAQFLVPRALGFLGIFPWLPGDLTNRMGNTDPRDRSLMARSSKIFCSANVCTPEKKEDLKANDFHLSNHPNGLYLLVCLKMLCGCA